MLIAREAGHRRAARESERLARALTPDTAAGITRDAVEFAAAQAHKREHRRLRLE